LLNPGNKHTLQYITRLGVLEAVTFDDERFRACDPATSGGFSRRFREIDNRQIQGKTVVLYWRWRQRVRT